MKGKENQIIEVLNQVMGKGGICIHYILPVISVGVMAGRDFDRLVYRLFSFLLPFLSCLFVFGAVCWERGLGRLPVHLSVSPGIPYCHSTPRPLTGAQIRDQRISDCMLPWMCVRFRRCVCPWSSDKYTPVLPSWGTCLLWGKIRWRDTSNKHRQTHVLCGFFFPFHASIWSVWQSKVTGNWNTFTVCCILGEKRSLSARRSWVQSRLGTFHGGVSIFSTCLYGFSIGARVSSHRPKTHTLGLFEFNPSHGTHWNTLKFKTSALF